MGKKVRLIERRRSDERARVCQRVGGQRVRVGVVSEKVRTGGESKR